MYYQNNHKLFKRLLHIVKELHFEKTFFEYFQQNYFESKMLNDFWICEAVNSINWSITNDYETCSVINCRWSYIIGFLSIVNFDKNHFISDIANYNYVHYPCSKEIESWMTLFKSLSKDNDVSRINRRFIADL